MVAERLSHNNAGTVRPTYGHMMANQDDRTRRAIDNGWGQQGVDDQWGRTKNVGPGDQNATELSGPTCFRWKAVSGLTQTLKTELHHVAWQRNVKRVLPTGSRRQPL